MKKLLIYLLTSIVIQAAIPPISTYDAEARKWAKVTIPSATNTVTDLEYAITTELLIFMKSRGLRSRVFRANMYFGSGLQSMRCPVIADLAGGNTEYDEPRNFVDGDYTTNGLVGDGSSKYINTGTKIGPFTAFTDHHLAIYNRTSGILNTTFEAGVGEIGISLAQIAVNYTGLGTYYQAGAAGYCNVAESSGVGFYLGTVSATNYAAAYKNGVFLCSYTDVYQTAPNSVIFIHARALNNNPDSYSSRQFCFYSIGRSLDVTQNLHYYRGIQFSQRRANRAL